MPRHYITNNFDSLKLSHCTQSHSSGGKHFKEAINKVMFLQHSCQPFSLLTQQYFHLSQDVDQTAKWTSPCRTRVAMQVSDGIRCSTCYVFPATSASHGTEANSSSEDISIHTNVPQHKMHLLHLMIQKLAKNGWPRNSAGVFLLQCSPVLLVLDH